ncbi:MAG TPA: RidA family protein [Gemmatimonadales bacterium]|nr:RidA family protein [Gemmatimonadales bacterium]
MIFPSFTGFIGAALSILVTSQGLAQEARRYITPRTPADTAVTPFSGAVLVGNTLYLSGKIGLTPDRKVPPSAAEEARIVLDDVKATLTAAGMTMDDLVSVQIFCSDVSHYDAFNRVYRTYFTREFPARAFIGSGALLFGARFEVQAIAVKR